MVERLAEFRKKIFYVFLRTALNRMIQVGLVLTWILTGCKSNIEDPNSLSAKASSISSVSFSGIQAIDQIRSTTAQVAWESNSQAQFYLVYDASSSNLKALATIEAPASSATITNLQPGTTYQLMVRLLDQNGLMDSNTATQSFTTLTVEYESKKYPHLAISPSTISLQGGETTTFFAYGGTPPYTYLIASGSGTVGSSSGIFTAPSSSGATTIRVIDANQNYSDAIATTQGILTMSPSSGSILTGSSIEINSLGGLGTVTFSVTSGSSYGTTGACLVPSPSCIRFTAASSIDPALSGTVTLQSTDQLGSTAQSTITVYRPLSIYPATITLGTAQSQTFVASFGTPPYTFSVVGSGSINSSGVYTAPGSTGGPYSVKVTDSLNNSATASVSVASTGTFSGISTISNITGTTLKINWSSSSSAASYLVYKVSAGTPTYVATVPAPASNYTVTGLTPSTAYTFRVRMMDAQGATDSNTNDIPATTTAVTLTHNGWNDVKAVGAVSPVAQATGLSSAVAYITLNWNAMTPSEGSLQSYTIYRATASGGQNFASPLATGISSSTHTYTDSTVVGSTIYYYVVRAVVNGLEVAPATGGHPVEIKVITPPSNMVLVHRWIANQEMCGLLGSTTDPTNHYRCPYTGLGGNGTYFDTGHSFLIDRYEMGCNYSVGACAGSDCIGMVAPSTISANQNTVYYYRANGGCYINTSAGSGTTWTLANTNTLTSTQRALLASNQPGLPPLSVIDQNRSWDTCQAFTDPTFGIKRLPAHREQILAAAWDPALLHSTISSLESGLGTGSCNSQNGSGLTYEDLAIPSNLETIPSTNTYTLRSVRTGSLFTANCESRYKVRDYPGNVGEWSSDQLGTCSSVTHSCTGQTSALDASNTDWNGFPFDGTQGPGGGSVNVTNWLYNTMSFNATRFLVPLGLPMVSAASASYGSLAIGTSSGQFNPILFHSNQFNIFTDNANGTPARGAYGGGLYNSTTASGRFQIVVNLLPTGTSSAVGLRCGMNGD